MKYLLIGLSLGMLVQANAFAASSKPVSVFKTTQEAQANCPDVNNIAFKAGQSAPAPLTRFGYMTADFKASKNNIPFTNKTSDTACAISVTTPHVYKNHEELLQAKKSGETPCAVIPKPILNEKDIIQQVSYKLIAGGYGSKNSAGLIRCNYQYKGKSIDPETLETIDGFMILSN